MIIKKIKKVLPLNNNKLIVTFTDNTIRLYDVSLWFDKVKAFKCLKNQKIFDSVHIADGGYALIWNEEIDLSANEIYFNGIEPTSTYTC